MLRDDLACEVGEGVGEQRYAACEFPVKAGESVRAGRGRAECEPLVLIAVTRGDGLGSARPSDGARTQGSSSEEL